MVGDLRLKVPGTLHVNAQRHNETLVRTVKLLLMENKTKRANLSDIYCRPCWTIVLVSDTSILETNGFIRSAGRRVEEQSVPTPTFPYAIVVAAIMFFPFERTNVFFFKPSSFFISVRNFNQIQSMSHGLRADE